VVECICSLVALAALVEIRITAFYEFAYSITAFQKYPTLALFCGSHEFCEFPSHFPTDSADDLIAINSRRFFSAEFLRRIRRIFREKEIAAEYLDLLCG